MPVRIEIPWQTMLYILREGGMEEVEGVSTEAELNDAMGNGRNCFSCDINSLLTGEYEKLCLEGFQNKWDGRVLLMVEKETYPGKYLIGEFY